MKAYFNPLSEETNKQRQREKNEEKERKKKKKEEEKNKKKTHSPLIKQKRTSKNNNNIYIYTRQIANSVEPVRRPEEQNFKQLEQKIQRSVSS